jgi:hypothetical protein
MAFRHLPAGVQTLLLLELQTRDQRSRFRYLASREADAVGLHSHPRGTDRRLERQAEQEASGILNWALRRLAEYIAVGKIVYPQRMVDATNQHREEMDIIGRFVKQRCTLRPDATAGGSEASSEPLLRGFVGGSRTVGGLSEPNRVDANRCCASNGWRTICA